MSSIEDYSGLCGIIPSFAGFDNRIRCKYDLGHGGPCSFEKYRKRFSIFGYANCGEYESWYLNQKDDMGVKQGFIESVLSTTPYNHHSIVISSSNSFKIR